MSSLLPVAAVVAAIAFLIVSTASFERVKTYMGALSFDGDAFTFSRARFQTLVRAAGAILIVAAGLLFRSRHSVERLLSRLAADTNAYARQTRRDAGAAIRAETPAHLAAVLVIFGLGVALRLRVLWQPINDDESFTYIVYASRPWLTYSSLYEFEPHQP